MNKFFKIILILIVMHPFFPFHGKTMERPPDEKEILQTIQRTFGAQDPSIRFKRVIQGPHYQIYRSSGLGQAGWERLKRSFPQLQMPQTLIYTNIDGYEKKISLAQKVKGTVGNRCYLKAPFAKEQMEFVAIVPSLPTDPSDESGSGPQTQLATASDPSLSFLGPHNTKDIYLDGSYPKELSQVLPQYPNAQYPILPPIYQTNKAETVQQKSRKRARDGDMIDWPAQSSSRRSFFNVLENILTSPGPVLFHCKGGIHRTGMINLMVRYLQGGEWTQPDPKQVTVSRGNPPFSRKHAHTQIRNQAEAEYIAFNSHNFRQENLDTILHLSQDPLFQCLQAKFAPYLTETSTLPALPVLTDENKKKLWQQCKTQDCETLPLRLEMDALHSQIYHQQALLKKKPIPTQAEQSGTLLIMRPHFSRLFMKIRDIGVTPQNDALFESLLQEYQTLFNHYFEWIRSTSTIAQATEQSLLKKLILESEITANRHQESDSSMIQKKQAVRVRLFQSLGFPTTPETPEP